MASAMQKRAADWRLFSFVQSSRSIAKGSRSSQRGDLDRRAGKSVAGADKSARRLHGMTDVARNRDRYRNIAAETAVDRIECDPARRT